MQPLNYLQSTTGIIWTVVCVLFGFVLTALAYIIINKVPATWLCDYNEIPSPELLSGKRVSYKKSGIILSVITAFCLILCRLQFNKGYDIYFVLFALIIFVSLMITISDMKYTIIPDQFTILLGVLGLIISIYDIVRGYNILHQSWWSPIAGAFIGGIVMLLIDFIGMLIYKQDGMGFGDVKLFFAVGIFTGFPGTFYTLIISILVAAICFVVIILISKIMYSDKYKEVKDENILNEIKISEEISTDDKDTENAENNIENSDEQTENKKITGKTQLAFGPYIAIAIIAYIALFDLIYYLANLYLNLF